MRHECVEIRDVLPTFLEAASAEGADQCEGKSLLGLLGNDGEGWREVIDLEHDICYDKTNHWTALTDGRVKYIFHAYDGSEQLFDLSEDPHELHDLAPVPAHEQRLAEWRARMAEHLAPRGKEWVRNGRPIPRPRGNRLGPNYPAAPA